MGKQSDDGGFLGRVLAWVLFRRDRGDPHTCTRAHASPEKVTLEGDTRERAERASIEDSIEGTATATAADEDDDLGADAYVSSGDEDGAA